MVWTWNSHSAQGPLCRYHRVPVFYQNFLGAVTPENFDDKFLGGAGWFICPKDAKEDFRIVDLGVKVGVIREHVSAMFRGKFNLPPTPG